MKSPRTQHRAEYEALSQCVVRDARPSGEWLDALQTIGIPASPVQRIDDALTHAGRWRTAAGSPRSTSPAGPRTVLAPPYRFDGARKTDTTPPPTLGEHTLEVLRGELGYDDAAIAALRERGALGDWQQDP